MKKFVAVVLMLSIALMSVAAFAETRSYMLAGVQDAEGNVVSFEEVEDFPVLVFVVDDESMTCGFGTEEEIVEGTCEIAEQTEEALALNVTLNDGSAMVMIYVAEEDSFAFVDENGYTYVMMNVEAVEAAANAA